MKMQMLAKLTNFLDFHDFRKAVATAFWEISKISMENFETTLFLAIRSKIFAFQ